MSTNPYESPKEVPKLEPPKPPGRKRSVAEVMGVTLFAIAGLAAMQSVSVFAFNAPWERPFELIGYAIGVSCPTIVLLLVAIAFWRFTKRRT